MPEQKSSNRQVFILIILFVLLIVSILLLFLYVNGHKINAGDTRGISTGLESETYIIEVSGTTGLKFSGSIGAGTSQRTVDGSVPATYQVYGWPAVAVLQKQETYGTLTVTIKKEGNTVNSQTTYANYGVVAVGS